MASFPILLLVAILAPFGVGVLLAGASGFSLPGPALILEALLVAALFLSVLAAREAYAPKGGRCPSWGRLTSQTWHLLASASLVLAVFLLALLQWLWQTGALTLLLGTLGVLGSFFLFAPPLAWQRRGWGEFWAGLGVGLLPVAAGYYLQTRHFISEILLYGAPLSLAGFNVFLLLGFPAPGQEVGPEGRSLACRLGPVGAALLYTVVNILVIAGLVINLFFPAAITWITPWLWALIGLAVIIQEGIKRRTYYQEANLRLLCFLTLVLHLGMSLIFAVGLKARL
ncbi:MAG: hypothetical protein ACUVXF_02640 [Desulfobaccales bacterium]